MQSFLQFRRFRDAAQAQLERDNERLQRPNLHHESEAAQSPSSHTSEDSKVDLEKGEHPVAADRTGGLTQSGEPVEEKDEDELEEDDDDDFELSQHRSNLSRTTTQQSAGTALGTVLSGIEVRRRTTREGGDGRVFVVGYESEEDPNDPHNWSTSRRFACTVPIACIGAVVGFASAVDSPAIPQAAKEFQVSEVVESLATGLFLAGFGAGALFAGPISEAVGRNPVYIATLSLYMIFIMASALAPNIGAQLAFRFIAGLFGSTPLTCAGGSISDLWTPLERGFIFPMFANFAFAGPLLGPVIGGFIAQSSAVSWRWTEWSEYISHGQGKAFTDVLAATLIWSGLILIIVVLFLPETFPPILLKWKAQHLRTLTGDDRYRGSIEVRRETFFVRLRRALYRPFLLTSREPIIMLIALYLTVVYIVLFTFLEGFTFIFQETYGISQGLTGLCFLAIIIGLFGATALVPLIYKWAKKDLQTIKEQGGDRLPPEFRLWYSMLGGAFALPISLFWMGWTARPDISIWSPLAAAVLFGYGKVLYVV
jgi:MFS family permease